MKANRGHPRLKWHRVIISSGFANEVESRGKLQFLSCKIVLLTKI